MSSTVTQTSKRIGVKLDETDILEINRELMAEPVDNEKKEIKEKGEEKENQSRRR